MFKQCLHDWKEVGVETISEGFFKTKEEIYNVLYCPACNKEMHATDERVSIELKKIEIRNKY